MGESNLTLDVKAVKESKKELAFAETLISVCGVLALLLSVSSSYITAIIASIPGLFFSIVLDTFCKKEKSKNIFSITVSVLNLILAFVLRVYIENGLSLSFNSALDHIGSIIGRIMPLLETTEKHIAVSQCLFLAFMGIAVCFAVQFIVKRKSVIGAFFVFILTSVCSVVFFKNTVFASLALAAVFMISVAVIRKTEDQNAIPFFVIALAIITIIASVILAFVPLQNYNGSFTRKIGNTIAYNYDKIVYGRNSVLPEGDFSRVTGLKATDEPALEIKMTDPDALYLKGYVGGTYTGNGFAKIENSNLYSYSDWFYYLHDKKLYGWNELSMSYSSACEIKETNVVTVKTVGASDKYLYVPYEVININGDLFYTDSVNDAIPVIKSKKGENFYSCKCLPSQVKRYTNILDAIAENSENESVVAFKETENIYRTFVYSTYLDIPDNTRKLLRRALGDYEKHGEHFDYEAAKNSISSFLTANVKYNTNADYNDKYDFLQYFLEVSKEGYSVHYATAAALMLRYYGIPSRYVEGYIITQEQADSAQSNSEIILTQQNAHAWAEFYYDGLGWLPFEVTPPYTDVTENASPNDNNASPEEKEDDRLPDNDEEQQEAKPSGAVNDDKDKNNTNNDSFLKRIILIHIIILLVILLATVGYILYKRITFKHRMDEMNSSGNKAYALKAYSYLLELLEIKDASKLYHETDENSDLGRLIKIYEKAKFGNSDISDDERKEFELFIEKSIKDKKTNSSASKRFTDRFIDCRYL